MFPRILISPINVPETGIGVGTGSGIGAWDASTYYAIGDIVNYNGELYVTIQAGAGNVPSTAHAFWSLYNEQLGIVE